MEKYTGGCFSNNHTESGCYALRSPGCFVVILLPEEMPLGKAAKNNKENGVAYVWCASRQNVRDDSVVGS